LDDYFLPGEDEENSEEPDNELLQYFQMGDAEEKQLNCVMNQFISLVPRNSSDNDNRKFFEKLM